MSSRRYSQVGSSSTPSLNSDSSAQDDIEYRRMILALWGALSKGKRTVVVTDYDGQTRTEFPLEGLSYGCLLLETIAREFGKERRRLRVIKYRARQVRSGWHDFVIQTGGITVFPAIIPSKFESRCFDAVISSGNESLDKIMGGGIDCGTVTALIGPSGGGKSSLVTLYAAAAAERGRKAAIYLFEETEHSFLKRAEGLGFPLGEQVQNGNVLLRQLDVAELSPGEFVHTLMGQIEEGVSLVVIDRLNGYVNAMRDEHLLLLQLHELLSVLNKMGVATFLTVPQHGMIGSALESTLDVSYLADNVFLLRNSEFHGEVRRALSVLKKRQGSHELTIRELKFTDSGVQLSVPLTEMHGVLSGEPTLEK